MSDEGMRCFWIEYDGYGHDTMCLFEDECKKLPRKEFFDTYCKYCIEGKKLEAWNAVSASLNMEFGDYIWEEQLVKLIVNKLIN